MANRRNDLLIRGSYLSNKGPQGTHRVLHSPGMRFLGENLASRQDHSRIIMDTDIQPQVSSMNMSISIRRVAPIFVVSRVATSQRGVAEGR